MKNSFPGYYRPTEDEFSEIWENCLFVLDANVLLNLYRYSTDTREELLGILQDISDRLWIPHQAALEYQRKRLLVIGQQAATYGEIQKLLVDSRNKLQNKLRSLAGRGRHPFVDADHLLDRITTIFTEIREELEELSQKHPDLIDDDPIREAVTTLLEGKVGPPYSTERLRDVYKEGKTRYENEIPPGYRDVDKGGIRQYGDLVLWFQTIDQAKEVKRSIILVTDDRKDDWWLKPKGRTIGPRPELVNEIVSEAGVSFYLYSADPFMERAREYLERQISQEAIEEVREVRQRDEEHFEVARHLARGLLDEMLEAMRATNQIPSYREALEARMALGSRRQMEELLRAATRFPLEETLMTWEALGPRKRRKLEEAMRATTQVPSGLSRVTEKREKRDEEEAQRNASDESNEQCNE